MFVVLDDYIPQRNQVPYQLLEPSFLGQVLYVNDLIQLSLSAVREAILRQRYVHVHISFVHVQVTIRYLLYRVYSLWALLILRRVIIRDQWLWIIGAG